MDVFIIHNVSLSARFCPVAEDTEYSHWIQETHIVEEEEEED